MIALAILLDALFDGSMEMFEFVDEFRCAAGTSSWPHVTPRSLPLCIIPRDDLSIMIVFLREARWLLLAIHVAALPFGCKPCPPDQTRPERICRQLVSLAGCKKTSASFDCWPAGYAPYSTPGLSRRILKKGSRQIS